MSASGLRCAACWVMILAVPASSLWAAESAPAMLYAKGTAWINGGAVPRTSALFPGDLVQTRSDSIANINASGSNLVILADSLIKFEGPTVSLEHGSLSVATSKAMTARAGDVTVTPVSNVWSEFEVTQNADGAVQIVATKGNLNVNDGADTTTLSQGQQTTVDNSQDKKKKRKKRAGGAVPASGGGVLNSPYVIYGGAAAAGGILTWVLLQGDEPISPKTP